jgi:ELWxxDGT repeat protein
MKMTIRILAAVLAATLAPRLIAANAFEVRPNTNAGAMASLNGRLHFLGSGDGQYGLWTSDGTAAGTQLVKSFPGATGAGALEVCAGQLFANAGGTLWRSDGTNAGTVSLATPVAAIGCAGRTLYFVAGPKMTNPQWQLCRTDGTAANTLPVAEFFSAPANLTSVRGTLFFVVGGGFVYVTDGTFQGTRLLDTVYSPITGMVSAGGRAIYSATDELHATDGTLPGTIRLDQSAGIRPPFAAGSGALYFRDGVWQTDGAAAPAIVRWPLRGSSIRPLFGVSSGRFFFNGSELASSIDALWVSDGTTAGTHQLAAIVDASSLSDAAGLLFVGSGAGTSVTDGTSAPVAISALWASRAVAAGSRAYLPMFPQANTVADALSTNLYAYDLSFAASSLTPDVVPMSGGTAVTITGTGFDGATTVAVDGVAMTVTARSSTSLTFNAPVHARATADVVVTSGAGRQTRLANALTFTCDTFPVAVAGGSATTCALQPVPLTGSGGVTCSWLPADGLSDPGSCTPTAAPTVTTTYRLIVANAAGCASTNAADVTVTVQPTADVTVSVNDSGTFGGNSTATVAYSAGATYQWTATNAQILSDPTLRTITFRLGCERATLGATITAANGCAASRNTLVVPQYSRSYANVTPVTAIPGTVAVITGSGFACVTGVRFGLSALAASFHVDSDTQISATFPAGTTGGAIALRIDGLWIRTTLAVTLAPVAKRADFDGDGRNDIVFRNPLSGLDAVWLMNGTSYGSTVNIVGFAQPDYHIVGAADFDADGSNDLLLHNIMTGANAIWKMSKLKYVTTFDLPAVPDMAYAFEGTGDFNGDGKPDILVRNQFTGANAVWLMNGMTMQSTANLPPLPNTQYHMRGTADFNGDGKADIVWRDRSTGANAVWLMNGLALDSVVNLPPLPSGEYDIGAVADYNDDGKPDLVWRNRTTGANAIWLLDGATLTGTVNLPSITMPQLEMAGPR